MNKITFDPTKPYGRRDKLPVEIVCTDMCVGQPILAIFTDCGLKFTQRNCANGNYYASGSESDADLINIPEEPKYRAWSGLC